jgi:sigma-B regulation protein RsbU (phosphoserine phosphatase)
MAETIDDRQMSCLEIRGGNRRESYSVELPGLSAWIACRPLTPATEGGDLHYMTVCGKGAISRVVLADVAGHGDVVSSIAERLRDALREHVNTWDQSILLRELNNSFLAGANGVQFATAFVLGHYVQSGEMVFTNAGHVPPLWYRAAERRWLIISHLTPYAKEIADLPLGLIEGTP